MTLTYKNPWAKPHEPQEYARNVEPFTHAGCLIFHVLSEQWDVVKNGVCIAQRVTKSGAMCAADSVSDLLFPSYHDVRDRLFSGLTL